MTISCNQLDDLLLEGDRFSLETAAQHAKSCDSCMQKLAAWNEISEIARDLHTTWRSDMLWPRIERAIREDQSRQRPQVWRIAASLTLIAALASLVWLAQHRIHAAEFDRAILRASAVDEVEKAEHAHVAAIDRLEKLTEPKLQSPATPLLVSYKEKLMLLDDAIIECQTSIRKNEQNAYLRKQLLAIYSEKQRTLHDVLREETHASNQ